MAALERSWSDMELPILPEGSQSPAVRQLTPSGSDNGFNEETPLFRDGGHASSSPAGPSQQSDEVHEANGVLVPPPRKRHQVWRWIKLVLYWALANWYKLVGLGLIITMIVFTSIKGFSFFGDLLRWFQRRNTWAGWGIFLAMYAGIVALFIPAVALILGAGFVFGFWKGFLAVWAGGSVGQSLAFLLARYMLRDWVNSLVASKWAKWKSIDRAIEHEGWKLVLIMRLSPLIPYNLLNIAMATTGIRFWQFSLVSSIGITAECAIFTYLGSAAENITSIVSGDAGPGGWLEWVMLGFSVVMCVGGAIYVSYTIKGAVRRADAHLALPGEEGMVDVEAQPRGSFTSGLTTLPQLQESYFESTSGEGSPSVELKSVSASRASEHNGSAREGVHQRPADHGEPAESMLGPRELSLRPIDSDRRRSSGADAGSREQDGAYQPPRRLGSSPLKSKSSGASLNGSIAGSISLRAMSSGKSAFSDAAFGDRPSAHRDASAHRDGSADENLETPSPRAPDGGEGTPSPLSPDVAAGQQAMLHKRKPLLAHAFLEERDDGGSPGIQSANSR